MCVVSVVYLLIFLLEKRLYNGCRTKHRISVMGGRKRNNIIFLPELVLLKPKKLLYINQMRVNVLTVPFRNMRLLSLHFMRL